MSVGLIVGTGLDNLTPPEHLECCTTPYGEAHYARLLLGTQTVYILPRHGPGHSVPPHRINYRANVATLSKLGCKAVIATNAVGSLRPELGVGCLVLPDQFLDFTRQRPLTFFAGDNEPVIHTDMTMPYCSTLRQVLCDALSPAAMTATYLCTEGPRFETPAEIRMFAQWGADLVGMTGVPEVVLAREAGLCYATICMVTNLAAGLAPGRLDEDLISIQAHASFSALSDGLLTVAAKLPIPWPCHCAQLQE